MVRVHLSPLWGCSSVGRAPALQAGGQEFESLHLHSSERMPIGFTGDDSMQKKLCVMMTGKTVRIEEELKVSFKHLLFET